MSGPGIRQLSVLVALTHHRGCLATTASRAVHTRYRTQNRAHTQRLLRLSTAPQPQNSHDDHHHHDQHSQQQHHHQQSQPPPGASHSSTQRVNFSDTQQTFAHTTTPALARAWLVLRLCALRPLVANSEALLKLAYRLLPRPLVDSVIRHTFFAHFCAGETAAQVGVRVRRLEAQGVRGIFDYAAESDIAAADTTSGGSSNGSSSSSSGSSGSAAPAAAADSAPTPTAAAAPQPQPQSAVAAAVAATRSTIVARTWSYDGEQACDAHAEVFMECIRAVRDQSPGGFAAVKLTALGDPLLLRRASTCLVELRSLFHRLDVGSTGRITPAQFEQGYRRLFKWDTSADRAAFDDLIAQLTIDTSASGGRASGGAIGGAIGGGAIGGGGGGRADEVIDYIQWTSRVDIEDLARISRGCREEGPFSRAAAALDGDGIALLRAMRARVGRLADAAAGCGVRLLIDAEQTITQPLIDNVVTALQRKHNALPSLAAAPSSSPVVYGTYQCYLRDAVPRLREDLERARRGNYAFAAKLVRGAYMETERERAAALGAPSPICATIEDTHASYAAATDLILSHMAAGHRAEVMFATHNQGSVEHALARMAELGLAPGGGSGGGGGGGGRGGGAVSFAQLLGMSDHLSFALGARGYLVYKYLPYGRVSEVIPYLLRRARENSSVLGGAAHERALLARELRRRLRG